VRVANFESFELVAVGIVSIAASFRLFVVYKPPSTSDNDPVPIVHITHHTLKRLYRKTLRSFYGVIYIFPK